MMTQGNECSQIENPTTEAIGSTDCYTRSVWSLSVSRLVPWHEEQNSLPVPSMDNGFFIDGDDGEHTRATPFLVVKVKPSMMIWSMTVQCRGVLEAAIKETVESLNRLG